MTERMPIDVRMIDKLPLRMTMICEMTTIDGGGNWLTTKIMKLVPTDEEEMDFGRLLDTTPFSDMRVVRKRKGFIKETPEQKVFKCIDKFGGRASPGQIQHTNKWLVEMQRRICDYMIEKGLIETIIVKTRTRPGLYYVRVKPN